MRLLETPNTTDPNYDLIGAYLRDTGSDIELRFDILGSPNLKAYDIYLAVDMAGTQTIRHEFQIEQTIDWDLLFVFPGIGQPRVITPDGQIASIRPRSIRGGISDSIRILIAKKAFTGDWKEARFQASITQSGNPIVVDQIGPFSFENPAVTIQAPLALVFWDVLPAATPAQTLRRWNGAHTGPFGQRHGLKILLDAASQTRVPLVLLDLQQPDRLAALESLEGLGLVRDLQQRGLLMIPDYGAGSPEIIQQGLQLNTRAAEQYKLKRTDMYYGAFQGDSTGGYKIVFARQQDATHMNMWNNLRIIPLPTNLPGENDTVTSQGLGIEARKALLAVAISGQTDDLVVFGGSLPTSPWADLLIASPGFMDISTHPWIKVLDQIGLESFPAIPGSPDCPDLLCLPEPGSDRILLRREVLNALTRAPENLFKQLAWQAFLRLSEPTLDLRLVDLRAGYLGQVGPILSGAHWFDNPKVETSCDTDLDWDGAVECILASERIYFVIDPQGGRLLFGAAKTDYGPVQLVGQRSQFIIGLGDPMDWKPDAGLAGDPEDIPGGFADLDDPWRLYQIDQQPGLIRLTNTESGIAKSFLLKDDRLHVTIEHPRDFTVRLPLAFIDNRWLSPGAYLGYTYSLGEKELALTLEKQEILHIAGGGGKMVLLSPFDTLPLKRPEDPNTGYSSNYYVPFPISILEINGTDRVEVLLYIR